MPLKGERLKETVMENLTDEEKHQKHMDLIRQLIETSDEEMEDEELTHMLIGEKISSNIYDDSTATLGERSADRVAHFAGSWKFIFIFIFVLIAWMILNTVLASKAFDAYPFILLNLVLSCVAAIQAPLIMMSQNRQEAKDREQAANDYRVNLKSELIIDDLHFKIDQLLEQQEEMAAQIGDLREQCGK